MSKYIFFLKGSSVLFFLLLVSNVLSAGNYTWRSDAASSNWEDPLNWSGTTAIPVNGSNQVVFISTDNITIVATTTNKPPILNSNQTIGSFTVTSGSVVINSIINVNGTITISNGTLVDGTGQIIAGSISPSSMVIGGTSSAGATVNCSITGNFTSLNLRNSLFGNTATITLKSYNVTGYYNIGGNTFNGPTTFESAGNSGLRLSDLGEDKFNNDLTLIATAGLIYASYNYNTTYNGNITVKSTGLGVYFGNSSTNSLITSTLASLKTITANNFTAGVLTLKNFIQQGSTTPQNIVLGGTGDCVFLSSSGGAGPQTIFESEITVSAPIVHLNGAKFKEAATFTSTNTSGSSGGNIYEKSATFNFNNTNVNGYWTLGGAEQYLGNATFINNNVGIFYIANGAATFGSNVTFDNKSTGAIVLAFANTATANFINQSAKAKFIVRAASGFIKMAENGTTSFDCNVEVNSNIGTIYSVSGTGKAYLRAGRTITVGEDLGFSKGTLDLKNFIQEGTTSQSIVFPCEGNDNRLYLRAGCDFSGALTVQSNLVLLQGGIYRGVTDITMCYNATGNINNVNAEPVTFKSDTYIRNKGAGHMMLGNGTPTVTFEGNTYFYITGVGMISLSSIDGSKTVFAGTDKKVVVNISSVNNATAGSFYFGPYGLCEINSDVELNNNANANIVFGSLITGTSTLAAGKSISIPAGAFSYGGIYFRKFTQFGNTAQNLSLTGNSIVWFDPGALFNGDLNVVSPRIELYGGGIFNGECTFEKTGSAIDNWNGGNEFHKKVTIKSSGTSYILTGYTSVTDHFYDDVVFWNTSSGGIYPAYNGTTQFDGNILCKNTGTSSILFGNNTGVSNLANGKSISTEGFTSSGGLSLRNFKQLDYTTSQSINLSSSPTGTGYLTLGTGVEFNGTLTVSAPNFSLGGTYRGICSFTKTGSNNSACLATGLFTADATFTNSSNGVLYIGGPNWTFDGNVTLNNLGTSSIIVGNSTDHVISFNGINKIVKLNNASPSYITIANLGNCNFHADIDASNNSTGLIILGNNGTNGGVVNLMVTSHLSTSNFTSGTLSIGRLKQAENGQDINISQNTRITIARSEFYGKLTIACPHFSFGTSVFHNITQISLPSAIGSNDSWSTGNNLFEGDLTITNASIRSFNFGLDATNSGDIFKGKVIINKQSTGGVFLSNIGTSEYYGDIIYNVVSPNGPNQFGLNGGITVFKGDQAQSISCNYLNLLIWGGLKIDKSANHLTLNVPINLNAPLTLIKGNIISSSTNYLSFISNSPVINNASDQSFIDGIARRLGNTSFTFPVGKGAKYMPLSISAPSASEDVRVEVFLATPPSATTLNNTLSRVSSCQYWNVQRVTGSSNISLTIPWTSSSCEGINTRDISIAQYKNNVWQFFGSNNKVADGTNGSITSNAPFTSGYYTFGYIPFDESIFGMLATKIDGSIYPVKGQKINFRFLEQYKDAGSLKYKIYSNPAELKGSGTISTIYGHNYESIELQTLGLVDGKLYILEVTDEKNRKSYLKFEYKNN